MRPVGSPPHLAEGKVLIDDERKDETRRHGELPVAERVLGLVIRGFVGVDVAQHVDDGAGGDEVEDLHERVEQGDVIVKEVEVARHKDEEVEFLGSPGDACGQTGVSGPVGGTARAQGPGRNSGEQSHGPTALLLW